MLKVSCFNRRELVYYCVAHRCRWNNRSHRPEWDVAYLKELNYEEGSGYYDDAGDYRDVEY